MRTEFAILLRLLQYELLAAERHGRFLSVVMVTSAESLTGLRNFLGAHIRTSDVVADFDHSVAVLLGETDSAGALRAVERYKDFFDSQVDLRFSVVTYPADGGKPDGLLKTAYQRLNRAKNSATGTVVTHD